jgi:ABC-type antimicrobial peptide transport system permease subunit
MSEYQDEPVRQIVGIVGNVRSEGLANEPGPLMYVPHAQLPNALSTLVASSLPTNWVVRTQGDAPGVLRAVQDELRLVTRSPTTDVRTIEDVVSLSVSRHRLHMLLISVFAGSALLLAAVGVFGVLAYAVQQQTKDIGIRMALGAREGQIKSMVLRRGASLIAIGGAIGIVVAFFLSRLLAAVLFGVEPHDPAVFVAVPAILGLVGAVAIFLPAHWASRLNPLDALRND